ncbi:MAG: hypothetical protein JEZ11_13840 [Desulfobacterales bacterium]|nr:hypothetical protein [Desulfobacterales bacterium]
MSIRLIAQDLYRLIREVEALQQRIDAAPENQKAALEDTMRKKKAERDRMRRALDGRKE